MTENANVHFLNSQIRHNTADKFNKLPVFEHLEKISGILKETPSRCLVLTAETGAGKSTAVPFGLLDSFEGKVLMLEPRRLAVLSLAEYAAEISGQALGNFAGYRMHLDSKISRNTRLEIVTEAIALRMIQSDPSLEDFSVIVIDEFHERSVYADTFLAFLKEAMELRDNLYIIVMSATIDSKKLCSFLDCPVYSVPGRLFPVEIEYAAVKPEEAVVRAVNSTSEGSVLVFLPGIRDIKRTEENLKTLSELRNNIEICILHSSVSLEEERRVLAPAEKGIRRVILSSSIAETSLTLPDVTVVIDSGLSRINRFDPRTGMNHLVTETESDFSAAQRTGRAGRTKEGICIRLWAKNDLRQKNLPVELLRSDIMTIVLECACWGASSRKAVNWLDMPPQGAWNQAVEFLEKAGLLERGNKSDPDAIGPITLLGKFILSLGIHPRLGIIAAASTWNGNIQIALDYIVKYSGENSQFRMKKLRFNIENKLKAFMNDGQFKEFLKKRQAEKLEKSNILLAGFFDRLAKYEGNKIYQLYSGRKARICTDFSNNMPESEFPEYIIAVNADTGENLGCIYEAEALTDINEWLESHCREEFRVFFENTKNGKKVRKTRSFLYGKICIKEEQLKTEKNDSLQAYLSFFRENGIESFPWNKVSLNFFERVKFLARHDSDINMAEIQDDRLIETMEDWLLPFWGDSTELSETAFLEALRYKFDGRLVDKAVPLRYKLENNREVSVKYEVLDKNAGPVPVIEVIIQQIFGCKKTPEICGVPVIFRLLSPARRPLQVTKNLESFWKSTWPEICREMKGRYPKHNWNPDRIE